jgi:hypothetical protein
MQRPRPNKLHDDLDALVDGRPVELTDELAPLVEAADILRTELAGYQLDPGVADRHLEQVLGDQGKVVQLPVRRPAGGWGVRRRIIAVALAAALVLAPATMASAAALPGQAMYPFKLAIEQVRIASVQWSPAREAGERTRVADERRSELERLVSLEMFNQVGPAVLALAKAVSAAERAVDEAREEGAAGHEVAKLTSQLASVQIQARQTVVMVASTIKAAKLPSDSTRDEIQEAVEDAQVLLPAPTTPQTPPPGKNPPQTTDNPPRSTPPEPTTEPPPPPTTATQPPPTTATQPPPTTTVPPTTTGPPSTEPPPSTSESASPGAQGDQGRDTGDLGGEGTDAKLGVEGTPPTSTP